MVNLSQKLAEQEVATRLSGGRLKMNNDDIVPGFDEEKDDSIKMQLQEIDDKCLVLYLKGRLDFYNYVNAKKRIDLAIDKGFVKLMADCRQVDYISSTGISVLVETLKKTKQKNGDFVLLYLQPMPLAVLKLLGFQQYFKQAEHIDEAVKILDALTVKDWPLIFRCPICDKKLKAAHNGRFRCHECRTILDINPEFQVALG